MLNCYLRPLQHDYLKHNIPPFVVRYVSYSFVRPVACHLSGSTTSQHGKPPYCSPYHYDSPDQAC